MTNHIITTTVVVAICCCISSAQADTFGSGSDKFDIDFVTIGNPGNDDDTTGVPVPAGKVNYIYRMGQFEISEDMINKANTLGALGITHDNRGANKPATSMSWFEAAHFVNWLNTSNGHVPAYKFDSGGNFELWQSDDEGYDAENLYRNSKAKYFLPSMDEWYKAAYYDPLGDVYFNYPTGSDTAPTPVASGTAADTAVYGNSFETGPADITQTGGLSPHGTMGQGGNVWEWEETDFDLVNGPGSFARGIRGGDWMEDSSNLLSTTRIDSRSPFSEPDLAGFRVASIPEPSTLLLWAMATVGLLMKRWQR